MIGIEAVGSYIPTVYVDNKSQAEKFGEKSSFASDRIGALKLPMKEAKEETSDLAVLAFQDLVSNSGLKLDEVECLIVCTQNPDEEGLPHTSAIVQDKLGLSKNVAAFDISLGCSGYVYGLSVIKGFMLASGLTKGVLVTSDPYSKIVNREDKNTSMLFGDAATATLISKEYKFSIGVPLFGTDGSGRENLQCVDGVLQMNGRQVFNFAATNVPTQIRNLLARDNIEFDEIDVFLLHQGSKHIVTTIARKLGVNAEKVPIALENTGNTVSSSIPLLLERYMNNSSISRLVISGFGVGLSWATAILDRK
jgi:3-oxoacyl-[acyl-carrier-protein] synthase-3